LYQKSIDFGAHPNERAISMNSKLMREKETRIYRQSFLQGDSVFLEDVLRTTVWTGVCVLDIFQQIFMHRFEICGVNEKLLTLKRSLKNIAV